jgi:lipopolysaccharide transport system ATP-binding protein
MSSIISVNNLSKVYRLGLKEQGSKTLASQVFNIIKSPVTNFKKLSNLSKFLSDDDSAFWALNDVSFEVSEGEVLGIIGHNGAGKSTLLKILSRITDPTRGEIRINGRVSSLLEVGTGFHPELSGRENIYMNGTILGMRKKEIDAKLDEIIAFSGVEKHIDTAVKFYSSGMKVRLGFAVAAHLEPEILVIDEVLAVGDLEFQRKCLGKMQDVAGSGRTVLFVSHAMAAIKQLCTSCLVMSNGRIAFKGNVSDAVQVYISQSTNENLSSRFVKSSLENKPIELLEAVILGADDQERSQFNADEDIFIRLTCQVNHLVPDIQGYAMIRTESDEIFIESDTFDYLPNALDQLAIGRHTFTLRIPQRCLPKGRFKFYLNFTSNFSFDGHSVDSPKDILMFEVYDTTTRRGMNRKANSSVILKWEKSIS